jgi:hypothetical protein
VTSEPSNPWLTGVSNLFTREFFELGKRKMAPDGVWAQWVHLYGMAPDDLQSLLVTFADVFGHVRLFRIDDSDLILLGSESPLSIATSDLGWLFQRHQAVIDDLGAADVVTPEDLLGLYLFDREKIRSLAGDVELNTDDNMRIEYSAPLHLHDPTAAENILMLEGAAEIPVDAVEGKEGLVRLAEAYVVSDFGWRRTLEVLRAAMARYPDDPEIEFYYNGYLEQSRRPRRD